VCPGWSSSDAAGATAEPDNSAASGSVLRYGRLKEILGYEPDWTGLLSVVPIKLDERDVSAN
jgi:hypothetical protein